LDGLGLQEVIPPQEWKSLDIEWNFDQNQRRLSETSFTWVGEVAVSINQAITDGLTTGTGIFEALPYKAVLECADGTPITLVEAGINMSAQDAEYFCDFVKAPLRQTGNIDYLTDRADSFRFEFLAKGLSSGQPGFISAVDYIDIWYQVGKYPKTGEIALIAVSTFIILKEIYETIKRLADCIAAIVGGLTGAAESALQIAALVIYLVIVIIALVNMINQLVDLIFPFVYYHRAMLERTLWQKACDYLGLGFSSDFHISTSVHYNDYIMPPARPPVSGTYQGIKVGQSSSEVGYYDGSFGDYLRSQIEKYNGEIKIINGVLTFKRKGSFASLSNFRIPENKYDSYKYNASEIPANYLISYLYDNVDLNDYDATQGRRVQITTTPVTVINKKNITLKNLIERQIPYSLPNVKTQTTSFETAMSAFFNVFASLANAVMSLISPNSPLIPTIPLGINNSILILDTHFTSIHKSGVYLGNGKTSMNSYLTLGANALFYQSHYSEIAKPVVTGQGNQWKHFGENGDYKIHMCCEDAILLADNNYGTYKGNSAKFISIKWNPYNETAIVSFKSNEIYTNNLKATLIEPNQSAVIL
jgi:hypothetical protein